MVEAPTDPGFANVIIEFLWGLGSWIGGLIWNYLFPILFFLLCMGVLYWYLIVRKPDGVHTLFLNYDQIAANDKPPWARNLKKIAYPPPSRYYKTLEKIEKIDTLDGEEKKIVLSDVKELSERPAEEYPPDFLGNIIGMTKIPLMPTEKMISKNIKDELSEKQLKILDEERKQAGDGIYYITYMPRQKGFRKKHARALVMANNIQGPDGLGTVYMYADGAIPFHSENTAIWIQKAHQLNLAYLTIEHLVNVDIAIDILGSSKHKVREAMDSNLAYKTGKDMLEWATKYLPGANRDVGVQR